MQPFQNISRDDWEKQARKDVKSDENFEALFHKWNGMTLFPYYTAKDQPESTIPFTHRYAFGSKKTGDNRFWYNLIQIDASTPEEANSRALGELMGGADGIHFSCPAQSNIDSLMQDILPEFVILCFTVKDIETIDHIREYFDNHDHNSIHACIQADFKPDNHSIRHIYQLFANWPGVRPLQVVVPGTDSSDVEDQLVSALSSVNELMGAMEPDTDPTDAARKIFMTVELGTRYFEDIIRLRALRIITYKMLRAWGAEINPEDIFIQGVSNPWTDESYSPEVSMIKSATAAMAGILGGVQSLTINPLDPSDKMQCRIARNVSMILREESYFNKSSDALGGAYFIESVTDKLARNAWKKFQSR